MVNNQVLFSYTGHKKPKELKLFDKYIGDINRFDKIIEPFCGHFGFSMYHYKNFKGEFVLNDLNKIIIDIFKDVKEGKLKEYVDILEEFRKNRTYKGKYYKNEFEERKRIFLNNKELGKDLDLNNKKDFVLFKKFNYMSCMFKIIESPIKYEAFEYLEDILKRVTLTTEDYKECINKYKDDEKALIYLDPPYLNSYNKNYNYSKNKTNEQKEIIDYTQIYIDILKLLQDKTIKATFFFSLNKNAITEYIYKDFILEEYNKIYQTTKHKETVLIISNKKINLI